MARFKLQASSTLEHIEIYLYADKDKYACNEDAVVQGEAQNQIFEGEEYDYKFSDKSYIFEKSPLVFPSEDSEESRGRIKTGNYVGTARITVLNENHVKCGFVDFEIQSKKTDYRRDYRTMLNEITSYYVDLVMSAGSPVTQKFEPNLDDTPQTIYQKFAFVNSIIDTDDFDAAVHKIISNPVHTWANIKEETSIFKLKRVGASSLRQIATSHNRIPIENISSSQGKLLSLPRYIDVERKIDTIDTVENRFIKYVLTTFYEFCDGMRLFQKVVSNPHFLSEVTNCCNKLENLLAHTFFKQIGPARFMALNSPILQKKEGYREILQAWILFDLAAKLRWEGGDNVYKAGMKNVSALYEYWLFFKLLDIVSQIFDLKLEDKSHLVKTDKEGINLNLKEGRTVMIGGTCRKANRDLNVCLYYNRIFNSNTDMTKSGSWTVRMRPDYTLSVWVKGLTESQAEEQNLITHIHFDAKYRVEPIFPKDDSELEIGGTNLENEKSPKDELIKIYKRVDLLKMHAYNDAIRRTGGAYVLYPGSENTAKFGFHEIIPGLGAFSISPSSFETDSMALKEFIEKLVMHFTNRISQREQLAYFDYTVHKTPPTNFVNEMMPEALNADRSLIPSMTNVIVGFYKDEHHLDWILEKKMYNVRAGFRNGSLHITEPIINAKYVLLHNESINKQFLLRLDEKGARLISGAELQTKGYESNNPNDYYLVFGLKDNKPEKEYDSALWDIQKMKKDGIIGFGHLSALPVSVPLSKLILYRNK